MHLACQSGNEELVTFILATPTGASQCDYESYQPAPDYYWLRALNYGHTALAYELLQNEMEEIASDECELWELFQIVLESGCREMVDLFLPYLTPDDEVSADEAHSVCGRTSHVLSLSDSRSGAATSGGTLSRY